MNRGLLLFAAFCLAACGSSTVKTAAKRTTPENGSSTASAPSTTRPAPPTTRHVSATVADQLTQYALTAAINAAQTIYHQSYDYGTVSPASLSPLVTSIQFGAVAQASTKVVGVLAQDRNDVLLVMRSASGRWYCVTENATDGISYGVGAARDQVDSNGECQQPAWPAPGKSQPVF